MCQDTSGLVRFQMCKQLVSFIISLSPRHIHARHAQEEKERSAFEKAQALQATGSTATITVSQSPNSNYGSKLQGGHHKHSHSIVVSSSLGSKEAHAAVASAIATSAANYIP